MFGKLLLALLGIVLAWAVFAHTSAGSPPERGYVVRVHDTLWTIATEHYGGDPREAIWRIGERNDLPPGAVLHPGQRLSLP
jgi:hypothetical protein